MQLSLSILRHLYALVAAASFFHGFCRSEQSAFPHYSFLQKASSAPPVLYSDYIIVGGGTAGCALAATLSSIADVLVLERGGSPYGNPNIVDVGAFYNNFADVSPTSPAQLFTSEDGVYNARARVLGGGSAINAGFYSRANKADITTAGWDENTVEDAYNWVEKKVAFKPTVTKWQASLAAGLLEAGTTPYNGFTYEHVNGTKIGGTIFDQNGHRHTAADLLEYANPKLITVYLHATVYRILFRTQGVQKPRAYRVIFRDELGLKHVAILKNGEKNEIILSAGAIGSTQMLMLSGIGPKDQLVSHKIGVVIDQPMVGRTMKDNPMNAIYVPSPLPVEVSLIQIAGITGNSYIEGCSGLGFGWVGGRIQDPSLRVTFPGGIILEKVIGPISSGYMTLLSRHPDDTPSLRFNYFQHPEDLRRCVEGIELVKKVVQSDAFSKFRYETMSAEFLQSLTASIPLNLRLRSLGAAVSVEEFCLDTVLTIWHYHGGCQVGDVVDRDYRVMGVDALRVVDGSTFNSSPGTNPQATVMMLGRYVGLKIAQGRVGGKK